MKNQGITILQLVITIIIMLILASVAILYGQGVPREANIASAFNEVKEIESVLTEAKMLNQLVVKENQLEIFDTVSVPKADISGFPTAMGLDATKDYYELKFTANKNLKNKLELENVSRDYLLDLEALNLYLIKGIDVNQNTNGQLTTLYNSDDIERYYNDTYHR